MLSLCVNLFHILEILGKVQFMLMVLFLIKECNYIKRVVTFLEEKKPLNNILQTYLPIQKHLFIFKILQMANNFPLYGRAGN